MFATSRGNHNNVNNKLTMELTYLLLSISPPSSPPLHRRLGPWVLALPMSSLHLRSTATLSWLLPPPPRDPLPPPTGNAGEGRGGWVHRGEGGMVGAGGGGVDVVVVVAVLATIVIVTTNCCHDHCRCLISRRRRCQQCNGRGEGGGSLSILSSPPPSVPLEPSTSPSCLRAPRTCPFICHHPPMPQRSCHCCSPPPCRHCFREHPTACLCETTFSLPSSLPPPPPPAPLIVPSTTCSHCS